MARDAKSRLLRIIFATAPLLLGGCAALPVLNFIPPVPIRNLETKKVPSAKFSVHIISPNPPFVVETQYATEARRPQKQVTTPLESLTVGQYRNWSWIVESTPTIVAESHHWQQIISARPRENSTLAAALTWNASMRRLYQVDRYLLGRKPMPTKFHIILLPTHYPFQLNETLRSDTAFPALIVWPNYKVATRSDWISSFFIAHSVLQGLLADEAWKALWISKTRNSADNRIKSIAVQLCWMNADAVALIAGSPKELWGPIVKLARSKTTPEMHRYFQLHLAALAAQEPDTSRTTRTYVANDWFEADMQNYMSAHGFSGTFPQRGTDLPFINAALNFCRDFSHDAGGILSVTKPAPGFKDSAFFPVTPARASTARPAG